ncbi:MAG: SDR family oxidoreductase [Actinomycetota bacterium]|nr:MAG: SDR family oxidoreductase [Actinomycetota bacterium]
MGLSEFNIEGLVVGISGGGKGIGRALVLKAAEAGAHVFTCSRTPADLDSVLAEAKDLPGRCEATTIDLTSPTGPDEFIAFGAKTFGRIDATINNVGYNFARPALEYSRAEVDNFYHINLGSLYACCVAAAQHMVDHSVAGSIVNITSKAGLIAAPLRAPYSAMKAGATHLTRSLAAEWAEYGIRVNAVSPGATATPLMAGNVNLDLSSVLDKILLGHRQATPEEVALPALFLLSPAAGRMTGQVLAVDGGSSLGV